VSGGHLCEAEAPTEPAGETAAGRAAIRSFSRGITDFFAYTEKAYSKKTAYSAVF